MNMSGKFIRKNLYPLQDGVLNIVKKLSTPFYLTGGTALSRHYFEHRYSDDLDLFINNSKKYPSLIQQLFQKLEESQEKGLFNINYNQIKKSKDFTQIFLSKKVNNDELILKLDLVNDVAKRYGEFENNQILGKIDSWRNILSNKLSALFRFEAKDIVDIWIISKNRDFNWQEILQEAKTKEAGVDPIEFHKILTSFPIDELDNIKWAFKANKKNIISDIKIIAEDILKGLDNSIITTKT